MSTPKLLRTCDLDPSHVDASERLRPVSDAAVDALIGSITETGIVKDEIIVRHKRGRLVLIAGGHRLEACRRMGRSVPAKVFECDDDWARLVEIDDNLAGADLTVLDTAVFLAARKAIYEKAHPETRAGLAGAAARWDAADIVSFAKVTAEKLGVSERHVRRLASAGECLSTADVEQLRAAPSPVKLKDLAEIAKIDNDNERASVVVALARGEEKSAKAARTRFASKLDGNSAPVPDPVEAELRVLLSAWDRASKAARDRFLAARLAEADA